MDPNQFIPQGLSLLTPLALRRTLASYQFFLSVLRDDLDTALRLRAQVVEAILVLEARLLEHGRGDYEQDGHHA